MDKMDQIASELKTNTDSIQLLHALDEGGREQLLEHIKQARKANETHIHNSMEKALQHFPRLLRGPVKRIFGL